MEKFISVFDMFKIGVGPSSSHTLGPWVAALHCLQAVDKQMGIHPIEKVQIKLYGSLSKTGKGHGTDMAVLMGLMGEDPITTDTTLITSKVESIKSNHAIHLNTIHQKGLNPLSLPFNYETDLLFLKDQSLPHHPNALQFIFTMNALEKTYTYYSIGGGFIEFENEQGEIITPVVDQNIEVPFDFYTTEELLHWCMKTGMSISDIVKENEKSIVTEQLLNEKLDTIWQTMFACIYKGCTTEGTLPGGLQVRRRAFDLNNQLLQGAIFRNEKDWMELIKNGGNDFRYILDWVSCFALAVNEENASFGRVVTAPTNGAAGVIPAVLMYAQLFCNKNEPASIRQFLMTASAVGILFKSGATISAAMGGCQAEIGVSSAMAAAALTELLGGNQKQCLMAAEIAMEHHLGLTCDPVGGLVQIPCIERNTMGAIKAITAAQLALQSKPDFALVSLDKVIKTMWNTALDMSVKYKETADGGLAIQIPIALAEC
jgi:L-serine dehydratase